MQFRYSVAGFVLAATTSFVPVASAIAAESAITASYDLPAQDLSSALNTVRRISGTNIVFDNEDVRQRKAPRLAGNFTPEEAVRRLLEGSGLVVRNTKSAIIIGRAGTPRSPDQVETAEQEITVTGSRIKGARLASPEIRIDRGDIQRAGFGDLGEAVRSIPQNFGGGQNPGVGKGARSGANTNDNVTGGSAVNLRGLGADATLTLLNGHRLSFGGSAQGIDISGIPTEAIERVEIIPDGSSALYGSDAVAGVVNVILRRSFDGVTANARVGTATDGGGTSQLYQIVAGKQWRSGNLLVAYGFRRNEEVDAEDRDYTNYLPEPYPLIKGQRVHSALVSGSQSLFDDVRFSLDATFVDRAMDGSYNTNNILSVSHTTDRSLSISPSLTIPVDDNWSLSVASTYARSRNRRQTASSSNGTIFLREDFCYCHSLHAVEAYLEGSALSLPAGDVRAVLGAGYRKNRYRVHGRSSANGDQFVTTGGDQSDTYAFGEIQIPVISGLNETAFAKALTISVAGRYDRYNYSGSVTTPKIGLIYSPNNAVDLKFSWGRSFKAPTLASIYQTQYAYLLPLTYFGRSDAAPDESVLYLDGGSTSLRPERATTWTATVAFHPQSLPGLNADLSYFRVKYIDRVRTPIGFYPEALSPNYANYVTLNPSEEALQAAINGASGGFLNYTAGAYDPASVLYLIDNRNMNVAAQKIEGVDVNLSYRLDLHDGALVTALNGSWLRSRQKNGSAFPYFDLAGTIWNPPHFRSRASVGWEGNSAEAFVYFNYIGGVEDRRAALPIGGRSMFTVDLSLSYRTPTSGGFPNGFRIGLSVENLFDKRPPYLAPAPFTEPYDSTNYSPMGRFVALSLSQSF